MEVPSQAEMAGVWTFVVTLGQRDTELQDVWHRHAAQGMLGGWGRQGKGASESSNTAQVTVSEKEESETTGV